MVYGDFTSMKSAMASSAASSSSSASAAPVPARRRAPRPRCRPRPARRRSCRPRRRTRSTSAGSNWVPRRSPGHLDRRVDPPRAVEDLDHVGQVDQPRGEQDLLAPGAPAPPAVPALEGLLDACRAPAGRGRAAPSGRRRPASGCPASPRRPGGPRPKNAGARAAARRDRPAGTEMAQHEQRLGGGAREVDPAEVALQRQSRRRTTWPARRRRRGSRPRRPARRSRRPPGRPRPGRAARPAASAIRHWRSTCSIGWPMPRSVASDRTASSSARRMLGRAAGLAMTMNISGPAGLPPICVTSLHPSAKVP